MFRDAQEFKHILFLFKVSNLKHPTVATLTLTLLVLLSFYCCYSDPHITSKLELFICHCLYSDPHINSTLVLLIFDCCYSDPNITSTLVLLIC